MADEQDKSSKDDFRRAHDNDPKRYYQAPPKDPLDHKAPRPELVPRGPMASGRLAVLKQVREQEAIKRSRKKFTEKQKNNVHSKNAFNKNAHER